MTLPVYSTLELHPWYGVIQGQPLLWWLKWLEDIIPNLVTNKNTYGIITNSDLQLAGGLLHQDIIAQHYDVCEQTIVSKTYNLTTIFWQPKDSATTRKVLAHLLRQYSIHKRYHRYIP